MAYDRLLTQPVSNTLPPAMWFFFSAWLLVGAALAVGWLVLVGGPQQQAALFLHVVVSLGPLWRKWW